MNYKLSLAIVTALLLVSTRGLNARLAVKKPHYPYAMRTSTRRPNPNPMNYHGGPLLTNSKTINVYLTWFGHFSAKDKSVVKDFFTSLCPSQIGQKGQPTVAKWWQTITAYKDKSGKSVPGTVRLVKQVGHQDLSGNNVVKRSEIADLVQDKLNKKIFPNDPNGIYLVLTSRKVNVERFCMSSCGFHGTTLKSPGSGNVVIAHVGDPSLQCPGFCAWPYAVPRYGPPFKPLPAPNSVGADGMIINIAAMLAGAATNPFNNGYFQGDFQTPLEAVSACSGKFGAGAFPGFPGKLLDDPTGNATYNVFGANGRKFLVPAMWDPAESSCEVAS